MTSRQSTPRAGVLRMLVVAGGFAALSWEVVWQHYAALALGVSAVGTAITLGALMGGMTSGALLMGSALRRRVVKHPARLYGLMELAIGVSGVFLQPAFRLLEGIDAAVYQARPDVAPAIHLAGIVLIVGPAAAAMGATVPVLGLLARQFRTSLSLLYGLNTLGAGLGVLCMAFGLIPLLGVHSSTWVVAVVNVTIFSVAWSALGTPSTSEPAPPSEEALDTTRVPFSYTLLVVFLTGFTTLGLEVAWFRALRAAYFSTTSSFAILLTSVLLALAAGAQLVAPLRARYRDSLGLVLAAGGVAVLVMTPVIERMDVISRFYVLALFPTWLVQCLLILGPPMLLMGMALPWLLDQQRAPRAWGVLYAANTTGAVAGSLVTAWALLPALGFARTAWALGTVVVVLAVPLCRGRQRVAVIVAATLGLTLAVTLESGIGRHRIVGRGLAPEHELVAFRETPDSTVSVIRVEGDNLLFIDGFMTAGTMQGPADDYMGWMGRLPMLLHPSPEDALVICFGTGQTANGVRREGIGHLDVVDINAAVIGMAEHFSANEAVLEDPAVAVHIMDGRAWLRRTVGTYDVVTLEPMPPTFSGVNALYSAEFYHLVRERLNPGGVVAQWLPVHLVDPYQSASIARTFQEVFPDAVLWVDPASGTGILLGRRDPGQPALGTIWPGFSRAAAGRRLGPDEIRSATTLDAAALARFSAPGHLITDDNQLLSYSWWYDPNLHDFSERDAAAQELIRDAVVGEVELPSLLRSPPHLRWGIPLGATFLLLLGWLAHRIRGDLLTPRAPSAPSERSAESRRRVPER